jgi:hypothetical protein
MTTVDVKTEGRSAHEVPAWSRITVEPALCAAIDTLPPGMLRIAGGRFGWWDEHGQGCACAVGALFGGGNAEQVERLRRFGVHLGLAFQHMDDLLGIWGDPAVTGKSVYSDLRSRKKSLPIVAALTSDTSAGRELAALYHRDKAFSGTDLVHAAELIDIAGAFG